MRVTIVDMSGVFRAAWHSGADKPVSHAFESTLKAIRGYASNADRVVVATDIGPSFRQALSPLYKAHRAKPDAQMVEQMRRCQDALELDGYAVVGVAEYEADDVIATVTDLCRACGFEVLIHSADKDLLALVSESVFVRSTATGRLWRPFDVSMPTKAPDKNARGLGVAPAQVRDLLALAGDTADGVPGVEGVGAETASKLLRSFVDISGIIAALDSDPAWKGLAKVRESIRVAAQGWPDDGPLSLSVRLVTLRRDVPLEAFGGLDGILAKREPKPLRPDFGKDMPVDDAEYEDDAEGDPEPAVSDAPGPHGKATREPSGPGSAPHSQRTGADADGDIPQATGFGSPPALTGVMPQAATPAAEVSGDRDAGDSSRALVVAQPIEWSRALEPPDMRGATWLAKQLDASRLFSGYGTNGYGSPEQILAVLLAGREMGLGAMTALRGINVIKGRISMGSMLMVGLVLGSGKAEYFELVETTPEVATYATKRNGGRGTEIVLPFTIEDAKRLKLYPGKRGERTPNEPTMWEKDPENMLRHRAAARLARAVYPDVIANVYLPEEAEAIE